MAKNYSYKGWSLTKPPQPSLVQQATIFFCFVPNLSLPLSRTTGPVVLWVRQMPGMTRRLSRSLDRARLFAARRGIATQSKSPFPSPTNQSPPSSLFFLPRRLSLPSIPSRVSSSSLLSRVPAARRAVVLGSVLPVVSVMGKESGFCGTRAEEKTGRAGGAGRPAAGRAIQ